MTQTIYEGTAYSDNNPDWHEEDSAWKANHIKNMIVRNAIVAGQICEVGCGAGKILAELENYFLDAELSGFEISPYAYEKAKTRETARTRFYLEDVTASPGRQFDVVLVIDVIEHVEDYMGFLRKIRPVGTYKIFHIPLDLSMQSVGRVHPIMGQRESVGHIHYFFKDTALAALKDCGYTIIDHFYTASRLELPNQTYSSQVMRWPRRLLFRLAPDLAVRAVGGYSLLVLAQ